MAKEETKKEALATLSAQDLEKASGGDWLDWAVDRIDAGGRWVGGLVGGIGGGLAGGGASGGIYTIGGAAVGREVGSRAGEAAANGAKAAGTAGGRWLGNMIYGDGR